MYKYGGTRNLSPCPFSDCLQRLTQFSFIDSNLLDNNGEITQKYTINPITKSFLKKQLISVPKERELLEDNFHIISLELENSKVLEISSMRSVIEKLEYVTMEDKLAASFAASATRVWKTSQNWNEALGKFEKAKILSPNLGYIYGQWAWVCERANKIDLARENYHKAVQLDEDNLKLWYQWAMFELLKGDYRKAEEKFNMVLSKNPDDPRSWHGLGRVLYKKFEDGERVNLDNIEQLFQRGYIDKSSKQSERKHNSINAYFLNKINQEKGNMDKVRNYARNGVRNNSLDNNPPHGLKKHEIIDTFKRPISENIFKGVLMTGYIEKIIPIGAFVKSEDGKMYFLHISKVAQGYVKDINIILKVGQRVDFTIIKENIGLEKYPEIMLTFKKN